MKGLLFSEKKGRAGGWGEGKVRERDLEEREKRKLKLGS